MYPTLTDLDLKASSKTHDMTGCSTTTTNPKDNTTYCDRTNSYNTEWTLLCDRTQHDIMRQDRAEDQDTTVLVCCHTYHDTTMRLDTDSQTL